MQKIEVKDYKGRVVRLCKNYAYVTNGSRYVTRKSVANVVHGFSHKVWGGSDFTKPGWMRWYSESRPNLLRFGCHIFRNENARIFQEWAIAK
jgi:hypothetical protein